MIRERGVRKLLLVTSNFHTARAFDLFRRELGPRVEVRAIAAPDRYFTPDGWWKNREGRKTMFFELSKTLAEKVGL